MFLAATDCTLGMVRATSTPAHTSDLRMSISFRTFAAKNTTDHNKARPPC